jgi:lipoprotein-releasing system permease protein
MGFPSFISSRYLGAGKKGSISFIGTIAIAGIALGVAMLTTVVSITSAFLDEFTDKVLAVNSHLLVMKYGLDFTEYEEVMEKLAALPEVHGVEPFVIQEMMISKDDQSAAVLLKGIDPTRIEKVLGLPEQIVAGSLNGLRVPGSRPPKRPGAKGEAERRPLIDRVDAALEADTSRDAAEREGRPEPDPDEPSGAADAPLPGIVLGQKLAEDLGAAVGDAVQITTPLIGLDVLGWSPSEETPRTLPFRVIGIFHAGFQEYDTKLSYVDYHQAQRFFDHGDSVTGLEMTLHERYDAGRVGREVKELLGRGPYHITDWMTLNAPLFKALQMQKVVVTVVVAIIVGVAAFNIIATLVMMVFDKRREIAILKSMGTTRASISRIFLNVGVVIGLVGIAIGLAVGLVVCLLLQEVGWPLDPKVYLIDHLPARVDPLDFVLAAVVAFFICQLATILPALSASKLHPVDGLRQD